MNSLERLESVLQAQPVDQTPNFDIFMTRAARQIGAPLSRYYLDHRVLVEANLAVWQAFQLDIVQAISYPYREAADAGLVVEFPEDSLPLSRQPLIVEPEDVDRVRFPLTSFGPRMTDRLEAVRALYEQVGDRVPVMGWVEGALAEASDLCGMDCVMMDLVMRPAWLRGLLEKCTEVAIAFASAQIDAGARIIGLGDSVASQISPRMYRQFALPYEQRIFAAVKAKGAIPRLHICGNITHLLPDIGRSGADIVDLDWMVDLHRASVILNGLAVCGNLDPVAVYLQGTPETARAALLSNAAVGYRRWISAAGCEIPEETPAENLLAQVQTLRDLAGRATL